MARSAWRGLRLVVSMAIAAGALTTLPAAPVAAKSSCVVTNQRTKATFGTLQAAVDDLWEEFGDTLAVKGICTGSTVVHYDATIVGVTTALKPATLRVATVGTRPLTIGPEATVSIAGLVVTGGDAPPITVYGKGPMLAGGGILVRGELSLHDVRVTGNRAEYGGGIAVVGGRVEMDGGSRVDSNHAEHGGGIWTWNGEVVLGGSAEIVDDTASVSGGGLSAERSTIEMTERARVRNNINIDSILLGGYPPQSGRHGGGIELLDGSTLAMTDTASVVGNVATDGAGVWTDSSGVQIWLSGRASVRRNEALGGSGHGAGVSLGRHASMTLAERSSIRGNVSDHVGGGAFLEGDLILQDRAAVRGNRSSAEGGGVAVTSFGYLRMDGRSTIHGNDATAAGNGGGINSEGTLEGVVCPGIAPANVFDNTVEDCVV